MSEELKPCPFCGGGETYKSEWVGIRGKPNALVCKKCGAHGPYGNGEDGAAATWNRRTSEPMTRVIKWKRFNGTEETLPPVYEKVLLKSEESFRLGDEWFFEDETRREIKIGDEWTYWPPRRRT